MHFGHPVEFLHRSDSVVRFSCLGAPTNIDRATARRLVDTSREAAYLAEQWLSFRVRTNNLFDAQAVERLQEMQMLTNEVLGGVILHTRTGVRLFAVNKS